MEDPRLEKLAQNLIGYSVALQPGERILIECTGIEVPIVRALIRAAYAAGGVVHVSLQEPAVLRALLLEATREQLEEIGRFEAARMQEMHAYIGVRAGLNQNELSDVPPAQLALYRKHWWEPVHSQIRVARTKWCVLRYPNAAMAQSAGMSTEGFEAFYFRVCNLDYRRMSEAIEPLRRLMEQTDQVHITGPGTDLRFSIKGIGAVPCCGHRNIPDGELFTAPVRESVEGYVTFNVTSVYQGTVFEKVRLEFEEGRIVRASASDEERLKAVLDTDPGARYVGEFSLGFNPFILHPMRDTLFDEKIAGSFHFTPGNAYEEADNGNRSAVHWDLVCIQRPEYGGGEIYFDGELIRKDGRFLPPELAGLNPEALGAAHAASGS
ncbi:MAG TPA: aminopeptidase [Limnochordia bacterium]